MKPLVSIFLITLLFTAVHAQEGPNYRGVDKATHKVYNVSQKHGKNVLRLETEASCFYDTDGNITEKYIMQGNRSYKGKMLKNIRQDPPTIEILNYNHMNLLASRTVEYSDPQSLESTLIDYDAKGKILSKTSTRSSAVDPDMWELHYNQVGYVASYARVKRNDSSYIEEKRFFDYKDDLKETHFYGYDAKGMLLEIVSISPSDSILFRKEFKYDDRGNQIEGNSYDHLDNITDSIVRYFSDDNRLIQISEYYWNPRFGRIPNLRKQTDIIYE